MSARCTFLVAPLSSFTCCIAFRSTVYALPATSMLVFSTPHKWQASSNLCVGEEYPLHVPFSSCHSHTPSLPLVAPVGEHLTSRCQPVDTFICVMAENRTFILTLEDTLSVTSLSPRVRASVTTWECSGEYLFHFPPSPSHSHITLGDSFGSAAPEAAVPVVPVREVCSLDYDSIQHMKSGSEVVMS